MSEKSNQNIVTKDLFQDITDCNAKMASIDDIITQEHPMNKGCGYGNAMIENSIKELGYARGIVVDKDNVVVVGDKVVRTAKKLGCKRICIVETDGDVLVVVKRNDVSAKKKKGLELSLVDNLTSYENQNWDAQAVQENVDNVLSFNPIAWGGDRCLVKDLDLESLLSIATAKGGQQKEKEFFKSNQLSLFD